MRLLLLLKSLRTGLISFNGIPEYSTRPFTIAHDSPRLLRIDYYALKGSWAGVG